MKTSVAVSTAHYRVRESRWKRLVTELWLSTWLKPDVSEIREKRPGRHRRTLVKEK
jgi:hypothetical protein